MAPPGKPAASRMRIKVICLLLWAFSQSREHTFGQRTREKEPPSFWRPRCAGGYSPSQSSGPCWQSTALLYHLLFIRANRRGVGRRFSAWLSPASHVWRTGLHLAIQTERGGNWRQEWRIATAGSPPRAVRQAGALNQRSRRSIPTVRSIPNLLFHASYKKTTDLETNGSLPCAPSVLFQIRCPVLQSPTRNTNTPPHSPETPGAGGLVCIWRCRPSKGHEQ